MQDDIGKIWDENAPEWIRLTRAGYDVYRDFQNTPQFLANLPDVDGGMGLDIGCGEGTNTHQLQKLGAKMTGVDVSTRMIDAARALSTDIDFMVADAKELPFDDESFDFATSFMAMMDVPNQEGVVAEIYRVLKKGGFFQFSILHPCFVPPLRKNVRNQQGETYAIQIADYFKRIDGQIEEWTFTDAKRSGEFIEREFRVPRFHRTLSDWFNMLISGGFQIEHVYEPTANDKVALTHPTLQDTQIAPIFIHIRGRKG